MNYMHAIGLFVIGAILIAIVGAFIFSEKFRKDVISSEGEASAFGLINVKGVIIVMLTAVFCGAFIWILSQSQDQKPIESNADGNNFNGLPPQHSISRGEKDGYNVILCDDDTVCFTPQVQAVYRRNTQFYEFKKRYYPCSSEEEVFEHFWFEIDTVEVIGTEEFSYKVTFGEGDIPYHPKMSIRKTNDGFLNDTTNVMTLRQDGWSHSYIIMMGLGYPVHRIKDRLKYYYRVDRSNLFIAVPQIKKSE